MLRTAYSPIPDVLGTQSVRSFCSLVAGTSRRRGLTTRARNNNRSRRHDKYTTNDISIVPKPSQEDVVERGNGNGIVESNCPGGTIGVGGPFACTENNMIYHRGANAVINRDRFN